MQLGICEKLIDALLIVAQIFRNESQSGNISVYPERTGEGHIEIGTPASQWCSDSNGILEIDVTIKCDAIVAGVYEYWFHSGKLISPSAEIVVTK